MGFFDRLFNRVDKESKTPFGKLLDFIAPKSRNVKAKRSVSRETKRSVSRETKRSVPRETPGFARDVPRETSGVDGRTEVQLKAIFMSPFETRERQEAALREWLDIYPHPGDANLSPVEWQAFREVYDGAELW